jgi:GDP-mannose 6-dehydrogenase
LFNRPDFTRAPEASLRRVAEHCMKISVIGLGYVGAVSAACLARRGHQVVGVDVNPRKVALVNDGQAPVLEPGLPEALARASKSGRLRATADAAEAVRTTDISLMCVGTPSGSQGSLSLAALERVCVDIGPALRSTSQRHTVVIRSTVLPGTSEETIIPALETSSGLKAGRDFGFAVNPEYLREGSGVADFDHPEKTVIGELDPASGEPIAEMYGSFADRVFRVPVRVAEAAKYVDNAFHALKVGFANEVGALSVEFGIDSHQVMQIFKADRRLNISDAYLTPGFCFGGSCLPKDLRALVHKAHGRHVDVPILRSVLASNEAHFRRTYELLTSNGRRRIGLLGLAFKQGTDELRESPFVDLAERLIGKGYDLRIYDPSIHLPSLTGTNRDYIEEHLPHLKHLLMETAQEVVDHAETCVVASRDEEVGRALAGVEGRMIVDLVRLPDAPDLKLRSEYHGVAW